MKQYSACAGEDRHLKWRALDPVEQILMLFAALRLAVFSTDRLLRRGDAHAWSPLAVAAGIYETFLVTGRVHRRRGGDAANTHLCLSRLPRP